MTESNSPGDPPTMSVHAGCPRLAIVCRECVRAIALRWWGAIARHSGEGVRRCERCGVEQPDYCGGCFVEALAEQREALRAVGVKIGEPPRRLGSVPR